MAPDNSRIQSLVITAHLTVCDIVKQVVDVHRWLNLCLWRVERVGWRKNVLLKCYVELIQKKYFILKGKKLYYLGWDTKTCFPPLLVCIKLSSHVGLEASQTSMYSDYISKSEHKEVKKRVIKNEHYDQRTLSSCGRTNLNVGSTWSTAMMDM